MDGPNGFDGIHHLKVFVTDLAADLAWWEALVGARREPSLDHRTAAGDLFGCLVRIPGVAPYLELRLDPAAAGRTAGLDPITFAVRTRDDLVGLGERLDGRGIEHSPVLRGLAGWVLVARSPSLQSVRFYTRETHEWDPAGADGDSPWLAP
ncbi:VOC family protein [Nocardia alni]|uniref:VOC family protein n=1 Tax=Nocardia alni TaxID=2815723 RepID=UPI001C2164D1|nr:VOC family protein [Nocardia alni]